MLYCPNYSCQTANPESHKFCQKCRTPLPKNYLWATGAGAAAFQPGDILGDRYLCKRAGIFLDSKPGLAPDVAAEVSPAIVPYLRLSPYSLQVPQVYEILPEEGGVVLLHRAALAVSPAAVEPELLPSLSASWQAASPLRQVTWLWQIAQLWQPLSQEQAAASLLQLDLLRVEGSLLRLRELDASDARSAPTLKQLGQLWETWVPTAHAAIAPFLQHLCQQLQQGSLRSAEQLTAAIDQALTALGQHQTRRIQIATITDQGPTRQRNEDACYPPHGTVKTLTISANQTAADPAVVIVCDGIGGHQGGDVASNLAIATVQEQLQLLHPEQLDPLALTTALEQAVWNANDRISERNDSEQRFDRQRMGTTLVMGLVRAHELYATHVGDSRAYRISRWNCHQITQDDDIASREVRLGYSLYREALLQPGAGSLVQALGMASSNLLHPTVQRFVLDEDCVFLLCSDGLSDSDRVEECWDTDILPLLDGKMDIATVCQRLLAIANTRNGHDNVTIGLMYCQTVDQRLPEPLPVPSVQAAAPPPSTTVPPPDAAPVPVAPPSASTLKTQIVQLRKPNLLPLILGILLLAGLGGALTYFLLPLLGGAGAPRVSVNPGAVPTSPAPTATATAVPEPLPAPPLQVNALLQVRPPAEGAALRLLPAPAAAAADSPDLPPNSVLQVLRRQGTAQATWVQVRVCSVSPATGAPASPAANPIVPGAVGWLEEAAVRPLVRSPAELSAAQRGACAADTTPVSPSPSPSPTSPAAPAPPP